MCVSAPSCCVGFAAGFCIHPNTTNARFQQQTGVFTNKFFTYEGEWLHGKRHGLGKLKFADGGFFEGSFVNGEICGLGHRVWANKDSYSGRFRFGERHGPGIMVYGAGDCYDGFWVRSP